MVYLGKSQSGAERRKKQVLKNLGSGSTSWLHICIRSLIKKIKSEVTPMTV